ncbi:MAG: CAP domain-containing protein [Candidatus Aminicenantes bacterium]|nr:CAP domain-containing protein [Candidatus Aminicenantes bacterium]
MKPLVILGLVIFWSFSSSLSFADQNQDAKSSFERPDVLLIEQRIFERVNRKRVDRDITPLKLSSELSSLARRHSQDMAAHQSLSHLSSSGKTYQDRLIEDQFYFGNTGENVARSDTFLDEVIHQKLMESPQHSENILDPVFDEIGVGVVYKKEGGYFITQDFLQSVKIIESEEVAKDVRKQINKLRSDHLKPSLLFDEIANSFAHSVSIRKAREGDFPLVPETFGETLIYFYSTPFPSHLVSGDEIRPIIFSEDYTEGGLGVWFGRNGAYPGGSYFITMIFFPRSQYTDMSNQDFVRILTEEINRKRKNLGLSQVKIDEKLSEKARNISKLAMAQGNQSVILPQEFQTSLFVSFITEDLYVWPPRMDEAIRLSRVKKLGIGITFGTDPDSKRTSFWVTVVFR